MKLYDILTEVEIQEINSAYRYNPSWGRLLRALKYPQTLLPGEKEEFTDTVQLNEKIRNPNLQELLNNWYEQFSYKFRELKTNITYPAIIEIKVEEWPQQIKQDIIINVAKNQPLIKKITKEKKINLNNSWIRSQEFDSSRSTHYFFLKNINLTDFIDLVRYSIPEGFTILVENVLNFDTKI